MEKDVMAERIQPVFRERMQALFDSVATGGYTNAAAIRSRISDAGIAADDHRLSGLESGLASFGDGPMNLDAFSRIVGGELLIVGRIFGRRLVIPDWPEFCHALRLIHSQVASDRSGSNADYIPVLRDADPEKWGVAVCSVDGQRFSVGDVDTYHSIQSVSKPITYASALAREGEAFTHAFVGAEPSGRPFNALDLLPDMRPFNPCVNAGAIMTAGIVASGGSGKGARELTQELMDLWAALSGHVADVRFSEATMLSERATAHNNFAIAHLLRGRKGLPRDVDLGLMIDLYLSCCSIEMNATMLSVAAATLANGGVCPLTGVQVLSTDIVKKTLAVMQFAGMYDNAGTFTLEVGLPAKSGVAGAIMVVVPNLMGFATFSPRLDAWGNSVRGVAFCRELVARFTFHVYDSLSGGRTGCKRDPRDSQHDRKKRDLSDLRWALAYGDRGAIKVRDLLLATMIDLAIADGEVADGELLAIAETLEELVGSPVLHAELREQVAIRIAAADSGIVLFDALLERLSTEQLNMDDNARELILESAFRVAAADGELADVELSRLERVAGALGIPGGVLELEVDRFRRSCARA